MYAFVPMKVFAMESMSYKTRENIICEQVSSKYYSW